jgi:hypothetical protein
MSGLMQSFSIEELEALTEDQIELLRAAIGREVHSNPAIHNIIRGRVQGLYDRMKSRNSQQPAGSGSMTAPAPGSPPPGAGGSP